MKLQPPIILQAFYTTLEELISIVNIFVVL